MFYKIILLGEVQVGKTSLRRSFMGQSLQKDYIETLGVDFAVKKRGSNAFQIWDIAGDATPATIQAYLKGTAGVLLLFDVMNLYTLDKLREWTNFIFNTIGRGINLVLIGNKIDLRTPDLGLEESDVHNFLQYLRSQFTKEIRYYETSAMTGKGVEDAFSWLFSCLEGGENV